MSRKLCRLCLKGCRDVHPIGDITRQMLEVLGVKIDLDVSSDAVICKNCLNSLQTNFDFKSKCLRTEKYIISLTTKYQDICDLTKIILERRKKYKIKDNEEICRLCIKPSKNVTTVLSDTEDLNIDNVRLKKYFPEIDLTVTKEPIICITCLESLQNYFTFVENCLVIEENIKKYCDSRQMSIRGRLSLNRVAQYMIKQMVEDIPISHNGSQSNQSLEQEVIIITSDDDDDIIIVDDEKEVRATNCSNTDLLLICTRY